MATKNSRKPHYPDHHQPAMLDHLVVGEAVESMQLYPSTAMLKQAFESGKLSGVAKQEALNDMLVIRQVKSMFRNIMKLS